MRSAFDFSPFRRSTVGFDRLFDMLENSTFGQTAQENYPPLEAIHSRCASSQSSRCLAHASGDSAFSSTIQRSRCFS